MRKKSKKSLNQLISSGATLLGENVGFKRKRTEMSPTPSKKIKTVDGKRRKSKKRKSKQRKSKQRKSKRRKS